MRLVHLGGWRLFLALVGLVADSCESKTSMTTTTPMRNGDSASTTLMPISLSSLSLSSSSPSSSSSPLSSSSMNQMIQIPRGGVNAEVSDIVVSAYDWCINLGAPSALMAGAVIATIYETIGSGALDIKRRDSTRIRWLKRTTRLLLVSSFVCEVMALFVTAVTGTMLLSRTLDYMDEVVPVTAETTPLSFLRSNFEFEYLTSRIAFLQGIWNWVASIGLAHLVPDNLTGTVKKLNQCIAFSLFTVLAVLMAFYNNHMTFYDNYWGMLQHWFQVVMQKFILQSPPRPMVYVILPLALTALYFGVATFFLDADGTDEDYLETAAAAAMAAGNSVEYLE